MGEVKELEGEFWSQWRMRWIPRFVCGAVAAISLVALRQCVIDDLFNDAAKRRHDRTADERLRLRAVPMARACHSALHRQRNREDSVSNVWGQMFEDPHEGGAKTFCFIWMAQAGE